jgi:hypothetical protein
MDLNVGKSVLQQRRMVRCDRCVLLATAHRGTYRDFLAIEVVDERLRGVQVPELLLLVKLGYNRKWGHRNRRNFGTSVPEPLRKVL